MKVVKRGNLWVFENVNGGRVVKAGVLVSISGVDQALYEKSTKDALPALETKVYSIVRKLYKGTLSLRHHVAMAHKN